MRSEKWSTDRLQVYFEIYIVAKPLEIDNISSFRGELVTIETWPWHVDLIGTQYRAEEVGS
jgi:hypothetical protein